jgi:ABC-type anion transport system duplicated permease subunit
MHNVLLGVAVMSIFVIALNQLFWRPMYAYAAKLTGLD